MLQSSSWYYRLAVNVILANNCQIKDNGKSGNILNFENDNNIREIDSKEFCALGLLCEAELWIIRILSYLAIALDR